MPPQFTPPLLTVAQAAADAKVARKTVYGWIDRQLLPAGRLPGASDIRIRREDWERFLESMFEIGGPPANDDAKDDAKDRIAGEEQTVKHLPARRPTPRDPTGRRDFFAIGANTTDSVETETAKSRAN